MKYFLLAFMLCISLMTFAQDLSILVVDDSKDDFDNTALITAGLDNGGIGYDLFDTGAELASPTAEFMADYDLVIWHTSTDGVGLYFWNANDEINGELALYLSDGGNLWVMGNDFLYDRYLTPYAFAEGEFAYDFLGIQSYDAQTNIDDGGLGVPSVTPSAEQPVTGLADIDWMFATLWYGDAVTGREGSVPIYDMNGDASYPLLGATAGLWYDNGTSKCLSFFFDLALASDQSIIDNTVSSVVTFFSGLISSTAELETSATALSVFPNPSSDFIHLSFEEFSATAYRYEVVNQLGQIIRTADYQTDRTIILGRDDLGAGMFFVNIIFENNSAAPITKKILFR